MNYKPFSLSQVRLLDGVFKDMMELNAQYLKSLDSDRLLHMFRVTAGLPSHARPLGGWEAPHMEIRGHTMGHYLSACALLYASTNDQEIKAKADAIIEELKKCQDALGSGYLSAFPETLFDRLEAGQSVWVPWYTYQSSPVWRPVRPREMRLPGRCCSSSLTGQAAHQTN